MADHDTTTVYVSLGENCLAQGVLDRLGYYSCVSPFAWTRSNIDYLLSIIQEDFLDFLNFDFLRETRRYNQDIVINTKYNCRICAFHPSVTSGFEFTHHNVLRNQNSLDSMIRKVDRFRALISSEKRIIFLYHHRFSPISKPELGYVEARIKELMDYIKASRTAPSSLIFFRQSLVNDPSLRGVELRAESGFYSATLHTTALWEGNNQDIFWGRVDDDLFKILLRLTAPPFVISSTPTFSNS